MENIYSILFIIACTVTVNGCPTLCRCSGTNVYCYNKSLTKVPRYNIPRSTRALLLEGNQITRLYGNSFEQLTALKRLYLDRNSITRIDANAFDGLSALTVLDLENNRITMLDINIFQNLTALEILWLNSNQITTVELNLFRGLTSLRKLYLQNNRITSLDINLFNDLTALTTLRLDNNPFNCSTCDVRELKIFLQKKNNFGNSRAKCEGEITWLINHNFNNCKELTTEHREETSTVSQQQTTLIITIAETTERSSFTTSSDNPASTTESTTELTTEHREETSTVSLKQTTLIITIAESETTESFQSSAGTDTPASTSESTSGIINTDVIIYLSCGVGFILLLSFSMACFYVGKKYQNNQNLGINQIVDTNNRGAELDSVAQRSPTVSTGRESGYGYAEIDELELSEFILTPPEQLHIEQDDTSSDSYDRISPQSNDYLNPYQSLLPSLQQSGNDHNNSDEYSHPDEENSAYTNLYQPIRFNRLDEFRQYASCSSVHYFEVLDDPIGNTNDVNMQEDSQRRRKTW